MSLFYTGKGDKGESFVGGKKFDKSSIEIEMLGDLDELNSLIGLVKNQKLSKDFKKILEVIQEDLFIIQANAAAFIFSKHKPLLFKKEKIIWLEKIINDFEKKIKPERSFVISGTDEISAWLDLLRAVSRRVERKAVQFSKKRKLSPEILAYLNRLSSLFFAMARMAAKKSGKKEKSPNYK